ncbi:MAG: GNAT family N-acetyltransferase [Bacteroidota bacterium]|nr:GNAT family N-acetyltransferase [Bacteroidota bacterium]
MDPESSQCKIRMATEKDIPLLDVLVNSAYRGNSSRKGWTTEADLLDGIRTDPETLRNMIQETSSVIFLHIGNQDRIQGCVYLKKKGSQLYLGMLTVSPLLQNKGIGKQLLDSAEKHAKQTGCRSIVMTVISVRTELINWYQRRGYFPNGKTMPFFTDTKFGIPKQPLEFIEMEKQLI